MVPIPAIIVKLMNWTVALLLNTSGARSHLPFKFCHEWIRNYLICNVQSINHGMTTEPLNENFDKVGCLLVLQFPHLPYTAFCFPFTLNHEHGARKHHEIRTQESWNTYSRGASDRFNSILITLKTTHNFSLLSNFTARSCLLKEWGNKNLRPTELVANIRALPAIPEIASHGNNHALLVRVLAHEPWQETCFKKSSSS
jgi:hypothetical protein